MAKFVLDLDLKGVLNFDIPPIDIGRSGDEAECEVFRKMLKAGDLMDNDLDGGVDGDIDFRVRKKFWILHQDVIGEIREEPD